jgi:cation diffusion facilitator family transporter
MAKLKTKDNIPSKQKAAKISIASNTTLILLKLVAGILTGSISLIAEAVHSLMDLAAAIIAFISVRVSDRPADQDHPYGHGKAENVSGVAEGALIFVASGIIVYEAIKRFIAGTTLEFLDVGIGIMIASIVANVIVSRYLFKVSSEQDSLALEADAYHLSTDVITMSAVLVALLVVRFTGFTMFDPIAATFVAVFIGRAAYHITKKSLGGLLDVRLSQSEEDKIRSCIMEHGGQLVGFHDLRTRKAGSQRHIDLHLVVPKNVDVEEAHSLCDHLEQDIKQCLPRSDVVIHVEPCDNECINCSVSCTLKDNRPRSPK